MPIYVGLAILIVNIIAVFRNVKRGVQLSIILAIACPVSMLGSTAIKYDYFALLPLALAYLRTNNIRRNTLLYYPFLVGVIAALASLAQPQAKLSEFFIPIVGAFKYLLIFIFIVGARLRRSQMENAFVIAIAINTFVAILQILDPNAVVWTGQLYATQSQESLREADTLHRLTGVLGNVAPFGFLSCLGLIFLMKRYSATLKPAYLLLFFITFTVGMAGSSKLFIILGPCVVIALLAIRRRSDREKNARKNWLIAACVMVGGALGALYGFQYAVSNERVAEQWERYSSLILESGLEGAMESRYGDEGITKSAMVVFWENPLFGVGHTQLQGEFVGDSDYVTMLHNTGITGLSLMLLFYVRLLASANRAKNLYALLAMVVMIIGGFGTTTWGHAHSWVCFSYAALQPSARRKQRTSKSALERAKSRKERSSGDGSRSSSGRTHRSGDGSRSSSGRTHSSGDGSRSSSGRTHGSGDGSRSSSGRSHRSGDGSRSSSGRTHRSGDGSRSSSGRTHRSGDGSRSSGGVGEKSSSDVETRVSDGADALSAPEDVRPTA